jgi:hypothetical protein
VKLSEQKGADEMAQTQPATAQELIERYKNAADACQRIAEKYDGDNNEYWAWMETHDYFMRLAHLFEEDLNMEEWERINQARESVGLPTKEYVG